MFLKTAPLNRSFPFLTLAVVLLWAHPSKADDEFEALVPRIRKTADAAQQLFRSVTTRSIHYDGKVKIEQTTELDIHNGFGRMLVTNDDSLWVFAANEKNAFHLVKDDKASNKWRIQQFADRKKDKADYERLWNVKSNNYIDSYVGFEGCRALLDMWDQKQLKVKSQEKNSDGTLSVQFVASDSAIKKLTEWEINRSRIELEGEPKNLEELRLRNLEMGPRPVDIISKNVTIDPAKGHFVTRVKSRTRILGGEIYEYTYQADHIRSYKNCYYSARTRRQRDAGKIGSWTTSDVIFVGQTSDPISISLNGYGLTEPKFGK